MLHLLLTFDYELFFNDAFCSEKEVLIDSTEIIQAGLDKVGVKATFFVDSPCIFRYKELGMYDFPKMVKDQLNWLLDDKHDIQLHLHPSWYTANYNGAEWKFEQKDYSLDKHKRPSELVIKAKNTLDSMLLNNFNYHCCAFRAGGFCLAPEREVLVTLQQLGIIFDSSVCCGIKMESIAQTFDWTGLSHKGQWKFNPKEGVRSSSYIDRYMIEIPVGTYGKIPRKWMLTHGQPKLYYPPLKGKTSPVERLEQNGKLKQITERVKASITTPVLFVMDSLHANALYKIGEAYLQLSQKTKKDIYVCAIAHPKFSSQECVQNMIQFIKMLKQQYREEIDFITFKDAFDKLVEKKDEDLLLC